MNPVILIIIILLIIILPIIFLYKSYKKSKNYLEKTLFILLVIIWFGPLIIYYLDAFNVPTILKWTDNVNPQNWLGFVTNYAISIISTIVGGIITMIITMSEIQRNNEDTEKREKENLRVQNMPILTYEVNNSNDAPSELENLIITNCENGIPYHLNIIIKNIGLNNVKKIKVDFDSEVVNKTERIIGEKSLVVLEKEKELKIQKFLSLKVQDISHRINIIVYYQDVLGNWYKQIIEIDYSANQIIDNLGNRGQIYYRVREEEKINDDKIKEMKL